jgi:hypothetical protein
MRSSSQDHYANVGIKRHYSRSTKSCPHDNSVFDESEFAGQDECIARTPRCLDRLFVAGIRVVGGSTLFDDAPEILLFVVKAKDGDERIPLALGGKFVRDEMKLVLADGFDLH